MPYSVGDRVKIIDDDSDNTWFVVEVYKFTVNGYAYGLTDLAGRRLFWIAEGQIQLVSKVIGDEELEAWFKL
jgi:hypothetical protein